MSTVVLYKSKYGSTKQYAEWIANDTGADIFSMDEFSLEKLAAYDTVIVGGYLHIGKIVGAEFLTANWPALQNKKVVMFSVGGSPTDTPDRTRWFENSVPTNIREHVANFPLRGRAMNLDWKDTLLMAFPRAQLRLKYWRNPTPGNKAAMAAFKPFDRVRRESIEPLVNFVRNLKWA